MASSKTLVIIAHPDLAHGSRVNARWAAELAKYPDEFTVRDLYARYPDGAIDGAGVEAERAALEDSALVVFQFPIYWYSAPSLLRTWMDGVYGFGWAYGGAPAAPGEPGRKLAGKRFSCAVSAGDVEASYAPTGTVGFTIEQVLTPFAAAARYVGATQMPPFALFGTENGLADAELEKSAAAYVAWLRSLAG